jgi:hypothetical protein
MRVWETNTPLPLLLLVCEGTTSLLLAVLTMGHERKSRGLDSHWSTHPSIVSLPLRCSKQQPSSALTVKFANLQVERNSSALLGKNEKARTKMMLKMKHMAILYKVFFPCCWIMVEMENSINKYIALSWTNIHSIRPYNFKDQLVYLLNLIHLKFSSMEMVPSWLVVQ